MSIKLPIFLDNNSTSPRDPRVLEVFNATELKFYGNPSSNHIHGWQASEVIEIAKEKIASSLNTHSDNIIFTSGASEANSLLIKGFFEHTNEKNFISSKIEHSSIISNIGDIARNGVDIIEFENDKYGIVDLSSVKELRNPGLISLHYANNEIGSIQQIDNLRNHFPNSFIHSDACQAFGKMKIDMRSLDLDCLTISSHKINGPIGIAALIFKNQDSISRIKPQILGGGHQLGLRSGTLPTSLIAAFGEAAILATNELENTRIVLQDLSEVFLSNLAHYNSDFSLIGPKEINQRLPGNLSLNLKGVSAEKLLTKLCSKLSFSTGSACQQQDKKVSHVLGSLTLADNEINQIIRIGIGKFNTKEEILWASEQIGRTSKSLQKKS